MLQFKGQSDVLSFFLGIDFLNLFNIDALFFTAANCNLLESCSDGFDIAYLVESVNRGLEYNERAQLTGSGKGCTTEIKEL